MFMCWELAHRLLVRAHLARHGVCTTLLLRRTPPTSRSMLLRVGTEAATDGFDVTVSAEGCPRVAGGQSRRSSSRPKPCRSRSPARVVHRLDHGAPYSRATVNGASRSTAAPRRPHRRCSWRRRRTARGSSAPRLDGFGEHGALRQRTARRRWLHMGGPWPLPRRAAGTAAAEDAAAAAARRATERPISTSGGSESSLDASRRRALKARRRRVERGLQDFATTGLGAIESAEQTERRLWLAAMRF